MPTGYTAGILDGTTKDFKQFAKTCSRAFLIHLRDEPFDSEYKKRTPSDYHLNAIKTAKETLKDISVLKDDEIIAQEKSRLLDERKRHKSEKLKDEENKVKMNLFLKKAKAYIPPTENHKGVAKFMVEQLEKTIDFDCNSDYHTEYIDKIGNQLENVKADDIRSDLRVQATKDIAYHTKEHEAELKRCREFNQWYDDFVNSL